MPAARRNTWILRFGVRALVVLSAVFAVLIISVAISSQFRSYSIMRMVITLSPNGSVNTRWLPRTHPRGIILDRHRGELIYERSPGEPGSPQPPSTRFLASPVLRGGWLDGSFAPIRWKFLDIGFGQDQTVMPVAGAQNIRTHTATRTMLFVPWWLLIGSSACPALLWLAHRLRANAARRQARGLCPGCAYDLRGIDSPLCPECATPRPAQKTTP